MKRYSVPRIAFINKLDRMGANPWKVIAGVRGQLKLHAAAVQIPIGLDSAFEGVIDIITREAVHFTGAKGNVVERSPMPESFTAECEERRKELIEKLAEVDDEIAELFISEEEPSVEQLKAAIRRTTIRRSFVPVFMGSAYKNKGVQCLLDGVNDYLPAPTEVPNVALDLNNNEHETPLKCDPKAPLGNAQHNVCECRQYMQ
jgi:elongation factor G